MKYIVAATLIIYGCNYHRSSGSYTERAIEEFHLNGRNTNKIVWSVGNPRTKSDSLVYLTLYSLLELGKLGEMPTNRHMLKDVSFYELALKDSLDPLNYLFINFFVTPEDQYFQFKGVYSVVVEDKDFFKGRIPEGRLEDIDFSITD